MRRAQQIIFALLAVNLCLLLAVLLPPLWGWDSPFAAEPPPLLDLEIPVQQEAGLLFGNLQLKTADGLSLPAAKLLINDLEAGNFGASELLVRVYEGDILTLDGSAYGRQLTFFLTTVSTNIDQSGLPAQIITEGNRVELAPIAFR